MEPPDGRPAAAIRMRVGPTCSAATMIFVPVLSTVNGTLASSSFLAMAAASVGWSSA